MKIAVFITSLTNTHSGRVLVEARNGSPDSGPFIRWTVGMHEAQKLRINGTVFLTIDLG